MEQETQLFLVKIPIVNFPASTSALYNAVRNPKIKNCVYYCAHIRTQNRAFKSRKDKPGPCFLLETLNFPCEISLKKHHTCWRSLFLKCNSGRTSRVLTTTSFPLNNSGIQRKISDANGMPASPAKPLCRDNLMTKSSACIKHYVLN